MTSPPTLLLAPTTRRHGAPRSRRGAFSLVEVVLAIGIIAIAFVAIFGMLPTGLSTFRKSVDNSLGTQIVQRITNEAKQTDFSTMIQQTAPVVRYFDDQGDEVETSAHGIYTVQTTILYPTLLPNGPGGATRPSQNLATVSIKLAHDPTHNPQVFDSNSAIGFSVYTAVIARNETPTSTP